jgi:two-component system, NarL family, response regulator
MYIRRASRVYKGKTYFNYLLVESVATPKGPRQKVVCSLGDLRPRPKREWLALAHKLQSALGGQEPLFRSANAVAATSSKKRLAVLVVDDNPIMRLGLAVIIGGQPDMIVCAEASSGDEAVQLYREHRPGVTLMDLRLPGGMSGIQALHAIRELDKEARCIVLTDYEGDQDIHQAMEAGALGYLIKGISVETLVEALRRVHGGSRFLPAPVARRLDSWTPNSDLSPREREVLSLIVQGNSNRDIADALKITEATVKSHVGVILARLGVADRTQAAIAALRHGLEHL